MKKPSDRTVEEIVEEKLKSFEYNESDIKLILGIVSPVLQAERQKREEKVEAERERIGNSILKQLENSPKIKALRSISERFREMVVKALTQPNNQK